MKNGKNFFQQRQMSTRKEIAVSSSSQLFPIFRRVSLGPCPPHHFHQADNSQLPFIILTLRLTMQTEKGCQASVISEPVLWLLCNLEPNSQATRKVPILLQMNRIAQRVDTQLSCMLNLYFLGNNASWQQKCDNVSQPHKYLCAAQMCITGTWQQMPYEQVSQQSQMEKFF